MSYSYLKKLWNETGIGAIIILLLIAYGVGVFGNYIGSKSYSGSEYMREIFGAVVMHENGILVSLAQTNVKSKFQMTKFCLVFLML